MFQIVTWTKQTWTKHPNPLLCSYSPCSILKWAVKRDDTDDTVDNKILKRLLEHFLVIYMKFPYMEQQASECPLVINMIKKKSD